MFRKREMVIQVRKANQPAEPAETVDYVITKEQLIAAIPKIVGAVGVVFFGGVVLATHRNTKIIRNEMYQEV